MLWSKPCKSNWNCALNLAFSVFMSAIVWNMCENLHYDWGYLNRANAIQTLLDMTAASASLAAMAKTRHRKKPWIAKISSSCQPRRRINTWGTLTCPVTTSAIMWWLWPHMKRSTTPSWPTATQQHSFTTSATMTCSCASTTILCCTRHHFPT